MAKLKIGANITKREEVKDLVIELVNRMEDKFSQAFLLDLTKKYLQGSPLKLPENSVAKIVELTLFDLYEENKVVCENGIFVKLNTKKSKKNFVEINKSFATQL